MVDPNKGGQVGRSEGGERWGQYVRVMVVTT